VDAPTTVRAAADYVCDGTADQVEINAALAQAAPLQSRNSASPTGAQQRGRVLLTGGQFNISAPIGMYAGTSLRGCGFGTQLRAVSNATRVIGLATPGAHLTEVSDLYIEGNSSAGGACNGIDYDMSNSTNALVGQFPDVSPDSYHYIHDLYLHGFTTGSRTAVKLWAATNTNNRGNLIHSLQIRGASANAIWMDVSSDSTISNCHIGNALVAYRIGGGNTRLSHNKSFYSDQYGLYITSGRCTVSGYESQDDLNGVYVTGSNCTLSGLTVDTCSGFGLRIGASRTQVGACNIFLRGSARYSTQSVGLQWDAAPAHCTFIGAIDPTSITTPISGSPGTSSFMRASNGGTSLVTAG
jgi:hypothetical protein